MNISHLVNTEADMTPEMMHALTRFEFQCVFTGVETTTPEAVVEFLAAEHGQDLADAFRPEFMAPAPGS